MPLSQQLSFLTRQHFSPGHSIICLQEVLTKQFDDLASLLGPGWEALGVGRDNGLDEGERCAIYFRTSAWEQLHFETVWLNEDGAVGRKGWDAGSVRVVSCLVLCARGQDERYERGRRVLIMNTHLDNVGAVARRESAKILIDVLSKLRMEWLDESEGDTYILCGDLNSEADGGAYQILHEKGSGLVDAYSCVDAGGMQRYGDTDTFTGFDGKGDGEGRKRIDFAFVGETIAEWGEVKGYAVIGNETDESRCSDHQAVVVDLLVA